MSISEERMEKALHYLVETDETCAEARAEVERLEFKAKAVEAAMFKLAEGKSVADREASSKTSDEVSWAWEAYFVALKKYDALKNRRSTESIVIDVFRTIQANMRQGK